MGYRISGEKGDDAQQIFARRKGKGIKRKRGCIFRAVAVHTIIQQ